MNAVVSLRRWRWRGTASSKDPSGAAKVLGARRACARRGGPALGASEAALSRCRSAAHSWGSQAKAGCSLRGLGRADAGPRHPRRLGPLGLLGILAPCHGLALNRRARRHRRALHPLDRGRLRRHSSRSRCHTRHLRRARRRSGLGHRRARRSCGLRRRRRQRLGCRDLVRPHGHGHELCRSGSLGCRSEVGMRGRHSGQLQAMRDSHGPNRCGRRCCFRLGRHGSHSWEHVDAA